MLWAVQPRRGATAARSVWCGRSGARHHAGRTQAGEDPIAAKRAALAAETERAALPTIDAAIEAWKSAKEERWATQAATAARTMRLGVPPSLAKKKLRETGRATGSPPRGCPVARHSRRQPLSVQRQLPLVGRSIRSHPVASVAQKGRGPTGACAKRADALGRFTTATIALRILLASRAPLPDFYRATKSGAGGGADLGHGSSRELAYLA